MFDTYVTIVGNVLTAPEWRRTATNALLANFKVASTARRLNRETGQWVDGNSLRVRVNCWRRLAEGVSSSVMVGDPVVVAGRLYTRDWTDAQGTHRTLYELEALAVGHDLSRGRAKFIRTRPALATSEVEDAEAEARVHGERTESVAPEEAPARPGEYLFDDDPDFGVSGYPAPAYDPLAAVRGGGFGPGIDITVEDDGIDGGDGSDGGGSGGDGPDDGGDGGGGLGSLPGGDHLPGGPGESPVGPGEPEPALAGGVAGTGRGRRGRARAAVPV